MKRIHKFILIFVLHISLTLLIPFLATKLAPADAGMAICMILFFAVYPLSSMALGVFSTTDIKALFWTPLFCTMTFPLCFSLAMRGMVWELYVYSLAYLFLGYASSVLVFVVKKIIVERRK